MLLLSVFAAVVSTTAKMTTCPHINSELRTFPTVMRELKACDSIKGANLVHLLQNRNTDPQLL